MKYLTYLLSSSKKVSSKRVITLLVSLHFLVTAFAALYLPRTIANPEILVKILEYDFFIMIAGLGFITSENFFNLLLEKARVLTQPQVMQMQLEMGHPLSVVDNCKEDGITVDVDSTIQPTKPCQ